MLPLFIIVWVCHFLPSVRSRLFGNKKKGGKPDGAFKKAVRKKIIHYKRLYADVPDPIVFMPVPVNTSGRLYDDFFALAFLTAYSS